MTASTTRPFPRTGLRGRPRRTWPQRLLLISGLLVAAGLFLAAQFFWEARTVLADLPRISVGPNVLAQSGGTGEPVNILLVGVDSSEGLDPDDPVRNGRETEDEARGIVRPDTILLLRLDPATGTASALSLPRDLIVEAPGGAVTRINATQAVGGIGALVSTIDLNFSIPVNHFVVADFAGFAEVVEIVGGVPVYFPYPTRDLGSGLRIAESGCWSLNGAESLAYVRARNIEEDIDGEWVALGATSPDLARIERQQEFMVLALEQVLAVGRSDISRISEFIDAGSQAVQLDETLTPGDMLDLASAFADYDTAALEVSTMPVAAEFSEDGRYLGEALIVDEAQELLARFQGQADGIQPDEVLVDVRSDSDRQAEQLLERGFVATRIDGGAGGAATTIQFDPLDREAALLLARYLEGVPQLVVVPDAALSLDVGNDFAGIRQFPRPVADIAPGLDLVIRQAVAVESSTTSAPSTTSDSALAPSSSVAQNEDDDLPSTSALENTDVPKDPATAESPPRTVELRGRPPANALCGPTGG